MNEIKCSDERTRILIDAEPKHDLPAGLERLGNCQDAACPVRVGVAPEPTFVVGDVVALRGGGSPMTVLEHLAADPATQMPERVECAWFQDRGGFAMSSAWGMTSRVFHVAALKKVEKKS